MPDVDVAILGGGCAGLSLAMRLANTPVSFRVVEPRNCYDDDRSWSFWRVGAHPFEDILSGNWSSWTIQSPKGIVRRGSSSMPYQTLSGRAFYDRALCQIHGARNGQLSLGVSAKAIEPRSNSSRIICSDGDFSARHVVDTRPPSVRPDYGQFFLGREVFTDAPVFDETCVQLMHFRSGYSTGVDFLYVLPFTAHHALVEVTTFAPVSPSFDVFNTWLNDEIAALVGNKDHKILREERGALPMQVGYRAPDVPGVTHMGLAGGGARPSTGYAFQRIQDQAEALTEQLTWGNPLAVKKDATMTAFMDLVFLRVLKRHPGQSPALFHNLFANVPKDRLERFLSGSTLMRDRLSIMSSLPPAPFLKAVMRMG